MSNPVRIGFLPLSDSLPLLVAQGLDLFGRHGLQVTLCEMQSWAQLRDALLVGDLDAAHCLAGIPLAAQAGLYGPKADLACALVLNHFGNAITMFRPLAQELHQSGQFGVALKLRALDRRSSDRPLTFASVFPVSKHEFELRHWLRAADIDPDHDVRLVVIPPPLVTQALLDRQIDAFCVGEPWNTLAVGLGAGEVIATSRSLQLPGTEKVLATRSDWLASPAHFALVQALIEAGEWLLDAGHRRRALQWASGHLKIELAHLRPGLGLQRGDQPADLDLAIRFSGINRPDRWHARWLLRQMQTNLHWPTVLDPLATCRRAFRSDVFDQVLRAASMA